jgi:hypothetical protein
MPARNHARLVYFAGIVNRRDKADLIALSFRYFGA